jgi:spermidine synthase
MGLQDQLHRLTLRHRVALGLMLLSGFAGLGYQIVWTQQCALWLGHEAASVLAVVTAFFAGLAIGSLAVARRIERSARPERWYAACEAVIALWSVVLALALAPISERLLVLTGAQPGALWQWCVAFFGTFVVLLPATAAMGATLPAMARVIARLDGFRSPQGGRLPLQTSDPAAPGRPASGGAPIAALYACNTFGAVIGVLASAFWLLPHWGLARTAGACAVLNLVCAAAALWLGSNPEREALPARATPVRGRAVLLTLALTGFLGIGYEILVVRVLSQVAQDTVYTYALLLAVYLLGSAAGAAIYQRWTAGLEAAQAASRESSARLLRLQAAACLLGTLSLWGAEALGRWVQRGLGGGMAAALVSEAALAVLAFGPATVVMGALFSHLSARAKAQQHGFGQALGVNTLGAAFAPIVFGVLLAPALGLKAALLLISAGYLALALPRRAAAPMFWVPVGAAAAIALLLPPLAFVDVPQSGRIVSYQDGVLGAVSVVEDAAGVARLRINNRQQEGSSASRLADSRQAYLPLLLHPDPKRALFLGLGTGVTASAAAQDPALRVDAVELLPEVIVASAHFRANAPAGTAPLAAQDAGTGTGLQIIAADARRFVRTTDQVYDTIVSDNFHPARSGSGALYTVEHFAAVRARLSQTGVFCQWLPLHQLDLDTLRSIVQAFIAVYPGGWAMLATNSLDTPVLGLVGRAEAGRFDLAGVRQRVTQATAPLHLADAGLADEYALLGSFVGGPRALVRFAGAAPLNTDDRPVVAYRAPRITYEPDSLPRDRLVALLQELDVSADEVIDPAPGDTAATRLAAYWAARQLFIQAGLHVRATADPLQMLTQVRAPLLAVLHLSPDFRPAYDPLLRIATALQRRDPPAARVLLNELQQVQPLRPEAQSLLSQLARAAPAGQ